MRKITIKALVVDDNEVNTLVLANMLKLFGIEVDQIYSGEHAIIMFQKKKYDIVFIDHVMPEMNGMQTAEKLHSLSKDRERPAIFALTSHVTESMKGNYREIGVNDVLTRPLELTDVITILKKWFPELPVDDNLHINKTTYLNNDKECLLHSLIKEVPGIHYEEGLKYAIGNPLHYVNILKISIKDIRTCINQMIQSYSKKDLNDLQIGIHNLKSLFSNIGALELYQFTKYMYSLLKQDDNDLIYKELSDYIKKTTIFIDQLEFVINQYDRLDREIEKDQEKEQLVITEKEYEQCLLNTIYYIKSYEYDSIIRELQLLIRSDCPELKQEFMKALEEIKEFDYDNALKRLLKIKKR